ncbi:MAG: hypothetical protein ABI389_06675 [Rhodanobacter sp.]
MTTRWRGRWGNRRWRHTRRRPMPPACCSTGCTRWRQQVGDGKFSGPVVNPLRPLWPVTTCLDVVTKAAFDLEQDDQV